MADLDDELARFEAELKALEQESTASATDDDNASARALTKRARDDDSYAGESPSEPSRKKVDTGAADAAPATAPVVKPASGLGSGGLAKPVTTETVVIRAAPKIYMAPPRPAPVKKVYDPSTAAPSTTATSSAAQASAVRPGVPNTIDAVFAHRGALSGFPAGVTGEHAARYTPAPPPSAPLLVPRFDMATGQYLSTEEQQLMHQQQSVYEYDPNKPLTSSSTSQKGNGANAPGGESKRAKQKKLLRVAGGEVWEDQTLADWPDNDFRLFCGDLGNEVSDEVLAHSFSRYASFQRARVVRDKYTHKSRGYGFVSFADPFDCAKALREMNGKYIGNRPVKLTKSKWQERSIDVAKKKMKKKNRHLFT